MTERGHLQLGLWAGEVGSGEKEYSWGNGGCSSKTDLWAQGTDPLWMLKIMDADTLSKATSQ